MGESQNWRVQERRGCEKQPILIKLESTPLQQVRGDLTHGVGVTGRPACLNPQEPHLEEFPKTTMSRNNG